MGSLCGLSFYRNTKLHDRPHWATDFEVYMWTVATKEVPELPVARPDDLLNQWHQQIPTGLMQMSSCFHGRHTWSFSAACILQLVDWDNACMPESFVSHWCEFSPYRFMTWKPLWRKVYEKEENNRQTQWAPLALIATTHSPLALTKVSPQQGRTASVFPPGTLIYKEQQYAGCPACLGATFATTLIS